MCKRVRGQGRGRRVGGGGRTAERDGEEGGGVGGPMRGVGSEARGRLAVLCKAKLDYVR